MTTPSPNPAQVFEDYFGPALFKPWADRLIEAANLRPEDTVLDLACATGTVARIVATTYRGDVTGLDFSSAMLDVARETSKAAGVNVNWIEGSADAMPFKDGQFDVVLSQQGLQFFPDRVGAANEIHRVLKPGGKLVASVWQGVDVHPLYGAIFRAVADKLDAPMSAVSLPFAMGDPDELSSYVQGGGFDDVVVTEEELTVRFTQPDMFVQLSVAGAAAAIPTFGAMDPADRASVAAEIAGSLKQQIADYVDGEFVSLPTALNQVVARK